MIDASKIKLPPDASKEVLDYLRQIREIVSGLQREVDALKKKVSR